jgi:hypothetical protein
MSDGEMAQPPAIPSPATIAELKMQEMPSRVFGVNRRRPHRRHGPQKFSPVIVSQHFPFAHYRLKTKARLLRQARGSDNHYLFGR